MIEVNELKNKKPFDAKEYAKCVLIALLPAMVITALLREGGVVGMLPTMIPIYAGAEIVKAIRNRRRNRTVRKSAQNL